MSVRSNFLRGVNMVSLIRKYFPSLQKNSLRFLYAYDDVVSTREKECKQKSKLRFWSNVGILLGTSYICYDMFQNREFPFVTPHPSRTMIPVLHAIESNESESPRNKFNFIADVADKVANTVVCIQVTRRDFLNPRLKVSTGSGFIVKSDGLILTNAHVVSANELVTVKLLNGDQYEGRVEHYDTESDLATIRIKAGNLPTLPLGQSSTLRVGEFVIAMGNPLNLSHSLTVGVVSSINRPAKDLGLMKSTTYIQTDAAVNFGNSGGPLVNLDGEAIGINTMKITEGISFAVSSDCALAFLKRIEKSDQTGTRPRDATQRRKYLGVSMLSLTPSVIQELEGMIPNFPNVSHGVMVHRILKNSPAEEAGLMKGDIITIINGKKIMSVADVYDFLKTEDKLSITFIRNNKEYSLNVILEAPGYS